MADSEDTDRELPASERRLQQAREEGNVPRSRDFGGGAVLLGGIGILYSMSGTLADKTTGLFQSGLTLDRAAAFDTHQMGVRWMAMLGESLWILIPIFGLVVVLAIGVNIAVGGLVWSAKPLGPNFDKLNPAKGLANIFSSNALVELSKGVLKTGILAWVGYVLMRGHGESYAQLMTLPLGTAISMSASSALSDAFILASVFFVVVAIDVPYQIWKYHKGMRMSLEELKREAKESEGDPHLKGKIRQMQRDNARKRMMESVPKADVVVTNPTHFSVALQYGDKGAPRVVAKGRNAIAFKIREIAALNGVPTVEAPPLARALYTHVELEQEIPFALYTAVARVLAYVYALAQGQAPIHMYPKDEDVPADLDPGPSKDFSQEGDFDAPFATH